MKQNETISAIATATGSAGVGIIRLSGVDSIEITDKIFCAMNRQKLCDIDDRKIIFGHVKNFDGKIIDEVIILSCAEVIHERKCCRNTMSRRN